MKNLQTLLSTLRSFEPEKISSSGSIRWKNPSLSASFVRAEAILVEQIIGLKTDNDIANLLEIPVGQLLFLLYGEKQKYNQFTVRKRTGKKRLIESPCSSIKILQAKVKPLIEAHYRVKKPVHGFVGGGKGIVTNAEKHKKKRYVLNLDLEDFFHSVNFGRVQGIFRNCPFNMEPPAATVMAQLCTYHGRLPQGACTSPVLSNLAAATLDKKLVQLAKRFNLTYTRYADDLTFSSNRPLAKSIVERSENETGTGIHKVGKLLNQAIEDAGFKVNHNKTRLQHRSQRQEVTGLVVNEGVNVNRKFIRNTRAMIHGWQKDLLEAEVRFIKSRYHAENEQINKRSLNGEIFKRAIYGRLSFIRMIKGDDHSPYLTLCRKVLDLDTNPPPFIFRLKEVFEMYDVFICHASEDKERVALPLHAALEKEGIKSFIDCFEIKWGDSLVSKINTALQKSRFVIAIISPESIKKSWPMKELNAVLSAEITSQETKLLPLLVGNSDELINNIPLLHDKLFATFEGDVNHIVDQFKQLRS